MEKVKQIVGGSLKDEGNQASTNFTSELDAAWYARQYQKDHLKSGHIILFKSSWIRILRGDEKAGDGSSAAYPGGMQIGGGITAENVKRVPGRRSKSCDRDFICVSRRDFS